MKNRRGSALLLAMVMSAIMLTLAVFLLKMVYNGYVTASYLVMKEKSFWLAEAGLVAGKVKLVHNPGWYTDLPHYPEDDARWVKQEAVGFWESFGEGSYKLVREKDQDRIYAVGRRGRATVVLRLDLASSKREEI
jgi:hypothetical protein